MSNRSTYVLFKSTSSDSEAKESETNSNAFFQLGDFVHKGYIDVDSGPVSFEKALQLFEVNQHRLPFYCLRDDVPKSTRIQDVMVELDHIVEKVVEEINGVEEELQKLQSCEMLDGVQDDLSNAHFKFACAKPPSGLQDVEIIIHKVFLGGGAVKLNMIYVGGSFHAVFQDGEGAHSLNDAGFPEMKRHGDGFKLRDYESGEFSTLEIFGDFNKDAIASKTAEIDDAPPAAEAHEEARNLSGYNQTYVVHKHPPHSAASPFRNIFFRCGNFCYTGNLDLGISKPTLKSLPALIPTLQSQQSKLTYVGEIGDLIKYGRFHSTLQSLEDAAGFVMQQITAVGGELERRAKDETGHSDWVHDEKNTFFELQTQSDHPGLENVELIATKTYMKELVLVLLYFEGSWFACLREAGGTQPLLDTDFPDLTSRGRGLSLGVFKHKYFMQLYLWGPAAHKDKKDHKKCSHATRPCNEAPEKTLKVKGDYEDYTQTYVIMRSIGAAVGQSTTREVLFRYGNWCYSGRIELGTTRLAVEDLPNVVPILQLQQSALVYMCKATDVPRSSRFWMPMVQMAEATQYLGEKITEAAPVLNDLMEDDPKEYGWFDSKANSNVYFQLRTDNHHHSEDVEMVASKTIVRGVQMIVIYFGGSYYTQVADAEGDHSLLNTRFPDVSWRSRGYHFQDLAPSPSVDTSHFRELSLWEGIAHPVATMNLKDELDRAYADEEEDLDAAINSADSDSENNQKTNDSDNEDDPEEERAYNESKVSSSRNEKKEVPKKVKKEYTVRAPHHIQPLKGLDRGKLRKLTSISKKPAPWEKGGRPLLLKKRFGK